MFLFIFVSSLVIFSDALLDRNVAVSCAQTFNSSDWTHNAFIVLLIAATLVILTFIFYNVKKCWPILKQTCLQRQLQHQLYTSSTLPTPASTYQTLYVQPSTSFQHQQLPP
ncbi:unnamed protein product [Rotaria magnacalcarata]